MITVKINQDEINKAIEDRNSVLHAMGFEPDNGFVIEEDVNLNITDSFSKYGNIIEEEISKNVFIVSYEKNDLYIHDLKIKKSGTFVGE